ncbi:MAG: hypothetical protein SF066_16680 [Thermoanaerobaculia bacterium]|nr:hypothetical protein [Thermoanaerobaculia bacterium]
MSTVVISISTTPNTWALLDSLAKESLLGKNVAEVAGRLLSEKLDELLGKTDGRAARLNALLEQIMSEEGRKA